MIDEDFDNKSKHIRQLGTLGPEQLSSYLSSLHNTLDSVAPNIAVNLYSLAASAIEFLHSKLPQTGEDLLQDHAPEPSPSQQEEWLDLYDLVNDPLTILDKVEDQTVTDDEINTVRMLYPDLYQEMCTQIDEHLGTLKTQDEEIDYGLSVAISKLIAQPLDSTLSPESFQAILSSASQNTGPAAQANAKEKTSKPSGSELSQINKANALYQTPDQARRIQGK